MKRINHHFNDISNQIKNHGDYSTEYDDKLIKTAQVVNDLFEELLDIFHSMKYTHGFQEDLDRIKRTWVLTFIENNFLDTRLYAIGLKKCRLSGDKFLPTAGQFMNMCCTQPELRLQKDTRPEWLLYEALESDELKARKKETALNALKNIKNILR